MFPTRAIAERRESLHHEHSPFYQALRRGQNESA